MKIERGIGIPQKRKLSFKWKKALETMKLGDSVVLPNREAASLQAIAPRYGCKMTRRSVDDLNVRLWLIEKNGAKFEY